MELKLYNSLGKKEEKLTTRKEKEISIYVCGITPYDTTHLGHAFTYLSFDVLIRLLEYLGYKVNYVQNVTDIDDDILKKAKEAGQDWQELGKYWTDKFLSDMDALGWRRPDKYVAATDSIPEIIKTVEALEDKGFAYEKDGTVYFEVSKFADYGKLSGFDRDQMIELSRERGADPDDPNKRNPLDFILWQRKKEDEPSWNSKFGQGRPGWHIECSTMINKYLGEQIDIHGGGEDLIYPHHESEIAQSESSTEKSPFVKFWMHTGSVFYEHEKMSKSLGNLVLVSDLLKKYDANVIRYLLLSNRWNKQWEYMEEKIISAKQEFEELNLNNGLGETTLDEFISHLNNNLDTPAALSVLPRLNSSDRKAALSIFGFKV